MKIRALTEEGSNQFRQWLEVRRAGAMPPAEFLEGAMTSWAFDLEVDLERKFATRYEFGRYVVELFGREKIRTLLAESCDGIWNWLTVAYFSQFGKKPSKYWHYVVTRRGHAGPLAYRHLARTSVEMYWQHGEQSFVMLNADLSTWGDMSEQLTSRQDIAYHRGCINAAGALYLVGDKLRRGAAGRVPAKSKRRLGDRRGRGGVARLALAVRRLSRTYDTHILKTDQMIGLLPLEFSSLLKT